MSLLSRLIPLNLLEEKAKFMVDHTYNPQFVYSDPVTNLELSKHGTPQSKYVELAQEIVDKAYFGRNEHDLQLLEKASLSQAEVTQKIKLFLKMHQLEDRYHVVWSGSFVSRTTINRDTIKLRLPVDFRHEGLLGMLYHEVGTHALRQINYEQQPWFRQKKKYGFSEYLLTEEGLASLHSLLPHSYKSAFNVALRYLAVNYAQRHSFTELWQLMEKYVDDFERRWIVVLRQKRGLIDTSQPGGFTKDLVYFQGLVEVWQWLKARDFDITDLYYGKLAKEDVEKAKSLNPTFEPQLPSFFTLNINEYIDSLAEIGKANNFK